ncbi:hypothetical protein [Azospirillum picis]|uniref:Uncharacterized protein n=1 Tax=Azospirillum picis TaxID=488438 RepID=A0ABU0MFE4_9PROT|nr:hypothetical protein [Azospirillum picis]MBP2298136.1 hypothetical protein [Azospirillum picis]MDQ0531974.1 hypothetical protein [Azospirillum picis]
MTRRSIGTDGIGKAILVGAKGAFKDYRKMSGGHWLDAAPESYIQSSIANEISRMQFHGKGVYVTLEASTKRILEDCNLKIDKRRVKMRERQRFDILVWSEDYYPRAVIEIKKCWHQSQCISDIKRIRQWLKGDNPLLEVGYIVAYSSAKGKNAQDTLTSRFKKIAEAADAIWAPSEDYEMDDEGWTWGVACISMFPSAKA